MGPWSGISSLQSFAKIYYLSHWVCSIFLEQPKVITTPLIKRASTSPPVWASSGTCCECSRSDIVLNLRLALKRYGNFCFHPLGVLRYCWKAHVEGTPSVWNRTRGKRPMKMKTLEERDSRGFQSSLLSIYMCEWRQTTLVSQRPTIQWKLAQLTRRNMNK